MRTRIVWWFGTDWGEGSGATVSKSYRGMEWEMERMGGVHVGGVKTY